MLYWACFFKNIDHESVKYLLKNTQAYPEGPNSKEDYFTPIHAAAYSGQLEKLTTLLDYYEKHHIPKCMDCPKRNLIAKNLTIPKV